MLKLKGDNESKQHDFPLYYNKKYQIETCVEKCLHNLQLNKLLALNQLVM